jgi:hypothetical protein
MMTLVATATALDREIEKITLEIWEHQQAVARLEQARARLRDHQLDDLKARRADRRDARLLTTDGGLT